MAPPAPTPTPGADFDTATLAAMHATAVFFPDYNVKLAASVAFVDPEQGGRPLYSCVRPECACAGVFFKDSGGTGCQVRLTVWLEAEEAGALSPTSAAKVAEYFRSKAPEVTLFYGRAACTETVSTPQGRVWVADRDCVGGGRWEVTFRPSRITGEGVLASCKATLGPNVLWTPGMELRTKPSEWLMVAALPEGCTEEEVRQLAAKCSPHAPSVVVLRRGSGGHAAFLRFPTRSVACGMVQGWKALRAGRLRKVSLLPWEADVVPSLIISLNRTYKEDVTLSSLLAPEAVMCEVVQQQQRPGYLPPPPASALPAHKRPAEEEEEGCVLEVRPTKRACGPAEDLPVDCLFLEEDSDFLTSESEEEEEEEEEEDVLVALPTHHVVLPVSIALPPLRLKKVEDAASPTGCGDLPSLDEDLPSLDDALPSLDLAEFLLSPLLTPEAVGGDLDWLLG